MNLSPDLQKTIEQIASSQGMSPEQFIVQALVEKINGLQSSNSTLLMAPMGLKEQDGILVFETQSLDHIDFNELIAQSREEQAMEQMKL